MKVLFLGHWRRLTILIQVKSLHKSSGLDRDQAFRVTLHILIMKDLSLRKPIVFKNRFEFVANGRKRLARTGEEFIDKCNSKSHSLKL